MKRIFSLILFFVLILPKPIWAWHSKGHEIVAELAKSMLRQNILDSVQFYLDTTSFKKAATWMDDMRGNPNFNYLKPTHYINIARDKTYVKVPGSNIMNSLEHALDILKNRGNQTREKIKMQLLLLFHLIGDLHQPLHVAYGEDRGGNETLLRCLNKKTNLHKLWDADLLKASQISLGTCKEMLNKINNRDLQTYRQINLEQWMNESRSLLPQVYDFNNNNIDEAYILKSKPLIVSQLTKAGIRLAAVLEFCFGR